jgi:hypothetical protein
MKGTAPPPDLDLDAEYEKEDPGCTTPKGKPVGAAVAPGETDLSHDSLALGLGAELVCEGAHVALWSRWMFFNGESWRRDAKLQAMTICRAYLRTRSAAIVEAAHTEEGKDGKRTAKRRQSTEDQEMDAQCPNGGGSPEPGPQ